MTLGWRRTPHGEGVRPAGSRADDEDHYQILTSEKSSPGEPLKTPLMRYANA